MTGEPESQPTSVETPTENAATTPEATPALNDAAPASEGSSEQAATAATDSGPASAVARGVGPLAARGLGVAKPASPQVDREALAKSAEGEAEKPKGKKPGGGGKKRKHKSVPSGVTKDKNKEPEFKRGPKVAVPNLRSNLPDDIQAELDAELASADFDAMMSGSAGMADRKEPLSEGTRVHGQILKIHQDSVFVGLGGPDQGVVPFEQFTGEEPSPGDSVEVMVRGFNSEDGLYVLTIPGQAIEVTDWGDLDEGSVVEVVVTGHNTGGLECKAGAIPGFIPISQVTEYRVEDLSEFVDKKFTCLVVEANTKRGNLVLSRRAILEREREEKRKQQLEEIEAGAVLEGTVRSVRDFGAFVDLGGVDGLIHVSKLSWERIKHPSEVIEEGQKVKVKVDSIDKESGKISLSYRDLLVNPWDTAEQDFAVGSIHKGAVTRIADFGCFVRLAAGVEGLVHISELAHHRVSRVDTVVKEGEDVSVKVLSFDRDTQKIGLSIKATSAAPESASDNKEEETIEPPREVAVKATHSGPLKGGNNRETGGERFGLRW